MDTTEDTDFLNKWNGGHIYSQTALCSVRNELKQCLSPFLGAG